MPLSSISPRSILYKLRLHAGAVQYSGQFRRTKLKEVFESVYRLTAKPQESNSLHFVANTQPPDAYLALRTQPNSLQGSRIKIMPNGTLLQVLQSRSDGW